LTSLPKSLEGSYHAILDGIDEVYAADAHIILQWMVCCRKPLQLAEVAEILAFDWEDRLSFDPDFRVPDPKDVLKLCSNLVAIFPLDSTTEAHEVRLAHSTVRDFLITETTSLNGPGSFLVVEELAHKAIAQMCLTYLLYIGEHAATDPDYAAEFPLVTYAAQNWIDHYKTARYSDDLSSLATSLFTSPADPSATWYRVCNIDKPWSRSAPQWDKSASTGPLYYASLAGLGMVVQSLLQAGADPNQKGGVLGNPLQAAVFRRDAEIVENLLSHGADPSQRGGQFHYPLMAAASLGYADMAKILLSHGASPGCEEFATGNVLLVASQKGHLDIVQLLLDAGADVNARASKSGTALTAAAFRGHESICKLLVERGAKDHRQDATRSAAMAGHENLAQYLMDREVQPVRGMLSAAAAGGLENMTRKLLDEEIDISEACKNVFQDAAYRGNSAIVRLMVERGYDINNQQDYCGTALHAAAKGGHIALMRELLDHETPANMAARGSLHSFGDYSGSVLENGVLSGRVEVVEFLIERGADVLFQEDIYGSALQLAASKGNIAIFKVLVAHGADINAHRGPLGSPLTAAAAADCLEIVEELLSLDCEVNTFRGSGNHDTAIEAAASVGNGEIIRLLLARGAKTGMDVPAGFYNGPLVTAAHAGYLPIVEQLLDAGADADAKCCRRLAIPLEAAVRSEEIDIAKVLLARGANINQECLLKDAIESRYYARSVHGGGISMTHFLIGHGADPNRHFKCNQFDAEMFPLLLAVSESRDAMVEILLSAGANVNEQNNEGWAAIHRIVFIFKSEENTKLCRLLIETWKADLSLRLANGSTALHLAAQKGNVDCMNIILDAGFNINDRNSLGQTALHVAAEYSQSEAVRTLLARDADLSIEDEKGQMTALDIAEFNLSQRHQERESNDLGQSDGDDEIVELLRAADKQRRRNSPKFNGVS
jgi:ankyrin repeat protein